MKRLQHVDLRFDVLSDWLTVSEARGFLHLSRSTMYDRLRRGKIPTQRFSRQYRIAKESLRPIS